MKRLVLAAVLAVSLGAVVGASAQALTTGGASDRAGRRGHAVPPQRHAAARS
jgi:hypothetical protein